MSHTLITTTIMTYTCTIALLLAYVRTPGARRAIIGLAWGAAGLSLVALAPLVGAR